MPKKSTNNNHIICRRCVLTSSILRNHLLMLAKLVVCVMSYTSIIPCGEMGHIRSYIRSHIYAVIYAVTYAVTYADTYAIAYAITYVAC